MSTQPRIPHSEPPRVDDSSKKTALILFGLAFLLGVVAYIAGQRSEPPVDNEAKRAVSEEQRRKLEASVNRHIQMTNRKIETDKEKVKIEAGFTIPRVGMLVAKPVTEEQMTLDLRSDQNEMNPVRDLDRRANTSTTQSARDIVQAEMADQQDYQVLEEQYKKEQARQFIENARRNGYDVKLGPDYRVIEVRPIDGAPVNDESRGGAFR